MLILCFIHLSSYMFLSHSLLFTKCFCFIHFSPRKVFVSLTYVHDMILCHFSFISLHNMFVFHSPLFTKGFSFIHSDVFVSFSPLHEMFWFHLLFFSKCLFHSLCYTKCFCFIHFSSQNAFIINGTSNPCNCICNNDYTITNLHLNHSHLCLP